MRRVGKGAQATCPPSITAVFLYGRHAVALRQTGTTGKSVKTCPAPFVKIFCFRSHANHRHNSARLTADEGRWPSSRTRGEMRWTRELRLTCVARAYGEVVWFGRRGAGVKFARGTLLTGDGGNKAVHRGELEVSRNAIAQGRPECFRRTCMLVCIFVCANRTRDRGCSKHPVFPAPSVLKEGKLPASLGHIVPRDRKVLFAF